MRSSSSGHSRVTGGGEGNVKPRKSSSASRHHGDFDDDEKTVTATLARILGSGPAQRALAAEPDNQHLFRSNAAALQQLRQSLPNPVRNAR